MTSGERAGQRLFRPVIATNEEAAFWEIQAWQAHASLLVLAVRLTVSVSDIAAVVNAATWKRPRRRPCGRRPNSRVYHVQTGKKRGRRKKAKHTTTTGRDRKGLGIVLRSRVGKGLKCERKVSSVVDPMVAITTATRHDYYHPLVQVSTVCLSIASHRVASLDLSRCQVPILMHGVSIDSPHGQINSDILRFDYLQLSPCTRPAPACLWTHGKIRLCLFRILIFEVVANQDGH